MEPFLLSHAEELKRGLDFLSPVVWALMVALRPCSKDTNVQFKDVYFMKK